MFDAKWTETYDDLEKTAYNISLTEAIKLSEEPNHEETEITTSCLGTLVFADDEWLYTPEEAARIAQEEIDNYEADSKNWRYCHDANTHCEIENDCRNCPYGIDHEWPNDADWE